MLQKNYHTQLAKMSFDEIFDLTAGVYFHFFLNMLARPTCPFVFLYPTAFVL